MLKNGQTYFKNLTVSCKKGLLGISNLYIRNILQSLYSNSAHFCTILGKLIKNSILLAMGDRERASKPLP